MINMDSEKKEQPKSGMSGWLIAVIVISIAAVIGTMAYFFYFKKNGNSFRNVGAANVAAVDPPAVPSMTNVTGGNMGATGGNARPSANVR